MLGKCQPDIDVIIPLILANTSLASMMYYDPNAWQIEHRINDINMTL